MPRIRILLLGLVLAVFTLPSAQAKGRPVGGKYFPGMLVVKIKPDNTISTRLFKANQNNFSRVQQYLQKFHADRFKSIWSNRYDQSALEALKRHHLNTAKLAKIQANLSRIYVIHYNSGISASKLAGKISHLPEVEYAEPLYIRKVATTPDDSAYVAGLQDYLNHENFDKAWNVSKGDTSVVIAIVDTGVDYNHEDLKGKGILGYDFWESGPISNPVQDSNPIAEYSSHGTHVAGIAAAITNNKIGIAGAGYNCRYMAVKVGGTKDHPDEIGFGFQGILYAATHGADIINCSWGSTGYAQYEQDVINEVTKMGCLVVCAAGNDNSNEDFYPASYNHTLSVASANVSNIKSYFSNYGHTIDVVATGEQIYSTIMNNKYGYMSGTSMAAPMVSGLAGLIKAEHPGWNPYRIAAQIRATSTMIDAENPDYVGDLGHGMINAYKALTDSVPGLSVVSYQFVNASGGKLSPGQNGFLNIKITNNNITTQNAQFILSNNQSGITITNNSVSGGVIAMNDTVSISFPIQIASDYNISVAPEFRLEMSDNTYNYSDFAYLDYSGLLYDVTDANDIQMSFSSDGSIGYMDPYHMSNDAGGIGFNILNPQTHKYYGNFLFSSGLMMYDFGKTIVDNVRTTDSLAHGFKPLTPFRVQSPGTISSADGSGSFDTSPVSGFPYMQIHMNTYAFSTPSINKTVFLKYTITNMSGSTVGPLYVGLHNDWDLGTGYSNSTGFDAQDSLLYVYDPTDTTQPYIAVAQMGNVASNLAIDNGYTGTPDHYHFSIYYDPSVPGYDGYTNLEKRYSLMAKDSVTIQTNTDVSVATASGPYIIKPDASINVGFIFAYGTTKSELISQVRAARALNLFSVNSNSMTVPIKKPSNPGVPVMTKLIGNYPNPFNPTTQIRFDLAHAGLVNLSIYNVLGQKVATLINSTRAAGSYTIMFSANKLSSGIYFSVLKTNSGIQTKKMTLIK